MSWIEWNRNVPRRICIVCGHKTREGCAPLGIVSGMLPCCTKHGDREVRRAYLELIREKAVQSELFEEDT